MIVLLLACWSPDPAAAPPELAPLDPVLTGEPAEDEQGPTEEPGDEGGEDPAAAQAEDEADNLPPFQDYAAATTTAPVTIVDDYGRPVTVLQRAGLAVKVVGEDTIRKRVVCDACTPVAEGWVQASVVTGRP